MFDAARRGEGVVSAGMANQPDERRDDHVSYRTPRWVKMFAVVALVLFAIVVVVHLAGGGFRGHMP